MIKKIKKMSAVLCSDMLLLPDGRILVQNLTQPMARLLHSLNPNDEAIAARVRKNGKCL